MSERYGFGLSDLIGLLLGLLLLAAIIYFSRDGNEVDPNSWLWMF